MSLLKIFSARLYGLLRREAVIQDMAEEMRLHLEMETEANVERGMPPAEARRAALRSFGNLDSIRERAYAVRGGGMVETLLQDIRYGARVLARNPAFTLIAVLTLGLGIGANTAIFSVVDELLLRPLPYADAERLVMVWEVTPKGDHQNSTSRANFRTWREQSTTFEGMAAFSDQRASLTGSGEPEELAIQIASPELFRILGVKAILGRGMVPEDGRPDAPRVAVLSHGLWQRRFGADPGVVGKPITLNGSPFTVVGVLPAGFQWHLGSKSGTGKPAELWTVLPMPKEGASLHGRFISVVARLKRGVSRAAAEAEMKTIEARIAQAEPEFSKGYGTEIIPLREQLVGNVRPALLVLLGAVAFVLLIACANVANLLLSRAAAREKEIALRSAIGARRLRVVRQLLTESLLLALLGSLLGLAFAWWGIRALVAFSPRDLVDLHGVHLNLPLFLLTLAISLATGILFGLAPALEATRLNLNDALKEGGKGGGGQGVRSRRMRGALVIAEVALALVLLVGAGLLVKSFVRLRTIDTGFETENVLTMVARLSGKKYKTDQQVIDFFREATERVRALPGVRAAGVVNYLPLYGGLGTTTGFTVEGRPTPPPGEEPSVNVRVSDAAYFSAMGIPLLRGRNFTDIEGREARHVVLISESMARRDFPGENPLGKRVSVAMFEKPVLTEIVGIVGDVRYDSLVDEAPAMVYFPHPDLVYDFMTLVIRTTGDPAAVAPAVRRVFHDIDPNQPISDVRTMDQVMSQTVGRARFNTVLLGLFAALATLLATAGIFGVMNYSVTLRTREIGLRMALGAPRKQVLMLILKQGLLLTSLGIGIGLLGALALTRLMSGLLFGVGSTDPATFTAIVLLLTAASLIACYIPARRATRVDPLIALRYE
ncbi:MAG TPA: ABC transporter permease [Thermoanaerobaculia bacterium]|jgi:putative ABC transport system permease protein|nr:ABC transporter permease [Thermoanaerobaculia bacterium]